MSIVAERSSLLAGVLGEDVASARQTAIAMGERRVSYAELKKDVLAISEGLCKAGVVPGDRIALLLPKSVETVELLLGILAAGAAYVPLNGQLPPAPLHRLLQDVRPKLVITDADRARELLRDSTTAGLSVAVAAGGRLEIAGVVPGIASPIGSSPKDLAAIPFQHSGIRSLEFT